MPIKIEKYIVLEKQIWTQEPSGQRFIAACASKAIAKRIAKFLNRELLRRAK